MIPSLGVNIIFGSSAWGEDPNTCRWLLFSPFLQMNEVFPKKNLPLSILMGDSS